MNSDDAKNVARINNAISLIKKFMGYDCVFR